MICDFKTVFYNLCRENSLEKDYVLIYDNSELDNGVLKMCGICPSKSSIKVMVEALKLSEDILEIDLSQSLLEDNELKNILIALKENINSVNTFKLDEVDLTNDVILNLSNMLMENHFLQRLSLKWCKIGEKSEAAKALFTAIGENDSLEYLSLNNNGLMSSLGKSLALCGLRANMSLRILDLGWNRLGEQAGNTIIEVLKINKNIQKIALDGNDISDSIATAINTQLSHNVQLHLKHAEMVSKTSALNKELASNKQTLSREVKDLQKGYQELELKGAQEQDHLLFELGRLGEQMVEKNQEFGALMEKLSLTSRALQVAEEKIEHLEAVDKQRNHHFKELQHQCAQHEKEQREEWLNRENDLEKTIERLSKEFHEARINTTKSQENCAKESAMNQEFLLKIQNMEKEKEVLIQSHENLISETKTYHDDLTKDLEQKFQDIKQENLRELENAYQQRVRMIDEEKKSKEHYKSKVEDLKQKLQVITSEHQDEIHAVIAKHSEQIEDCTEENQSKLNLLQEKLKSKDETIEHIQANLKTERKSREDSELEHERAKRQFEESESKLKCYEEEKDHIKEMVKVEFEQKLLDFDKVKCENEELKNKLKSLSSDAENEKKEYEKIVEDLKASIKKLNTELEEHKKSIQQLRFDEKKRAQGLMEAVKLFVSSEHESTINQQITQVDNNAE